MNAVQSNPDDLEIALAAQMEQARRDLELVRQYKALQARLTPQTTSVASAEVVAAVSNPAPQANPAATLTEANLVVRAIIDGMTGRFTMPDIEAALEASGHNFPRSTVRGVVSRMESAGDISVVSQGAGRRPSVFIKKDLGAR